MTLSSKTLSSKVFFIQDFSSENCFIQKIHKWDNHCSLYFCESVPGRRPATLSQKHGPNRMLVISEFQFGWQRRWHNGYFQVQWAWAASLARLQISIQRTTTTGLISCDAGEHCLDSARREWAATVLMYNYICGNSFNLTQYGKASVGSNNGQDDESCGWIRDNVDRLSLGLSLRATTCIATLVCVWTGFAVRWMQKRMTVGIDATRHMARDGTWVRSVAGWWGRVQGVA